MIARQLIGGRPGPPRRAAEILVRYLAVDTTGAVRAGGASAVQWRSGPRVSSARMSSDEQKGAPSPEALRMLRSRGSPSTSPLLSTLNVVVPPAIVMLKGNPPL